MEVYILEIIERLNSTYNNDRRVPYQYNVNHTVSYDKENSEIK